MAEKSRLQLRTQGVEIRDESGNKQNTALRVGTMLIDLIDSLNNIIDDALVNDYESNYATEAVILAKDPSLFSGQVWWATDTKKSFRSVESVFEGFGWVGETLKYDINNDTFSLPVTLDGHTQDIGSEAFFPAINSNGTPATSLNPKVFVANDTDPSGDFILVTKALSTDLVAGQTYGINTTDADVNGSTKIIIFGFIRNVNTDAFPDKAILYVSDTVAGDLTAVKPVMAVPVAIVFKSHPTDGILWVNANHLSRETSIVPVGFQRLHFTGDQTDAGDPAGLDNFYLALLEDVGTVASVTEDIITPSDTIVSIGKNHLSQQVIVSQTLNAGVYAGQVEYQVDSESANEKLYMEIYKAEADGTPIDSGILSEPVGALGVRPIAVLVSVLLNSPSGLNLTAKVEGVIAETTIILTDERIRLNIMAEKVGTAGGNKTFTIFFGSDNATFIDTPQLVSLGDLVDVELTAVAENEALVVDINGIWRNTAQIPPTKSKITINQVAHGFVSGDAIHKTATDYIKANATDDTLPAEGIIIDILDVDNFIYQFLGEAEYTKIALTEGASYYLDTSDGSVTETEPNDFKQLLFTAIGGTTILINVEAMFVNGLPRSPLTTKGDIYVHDGELNARLPIGSNDQVLVADNLESLGIKWSTQTQSNILEAHIQLTQSEIQALNTTPIELIPALGVGKYPEIISGSSFNNHNGTDYVGGSNLLLQQDSLGFTIAVAGALFISSSADLFRKLGIQQATDMNDNEAVTVKADADSTGAGGVIDIWVLYIERDIN